jgi:hypothetical protein
LIFDDMSVGGRVAPVEQTGSTPAYTRLNLRTGLGAVNRLLG